MALVSIDFQEGFGGDSVVIKVDGRELHRQQGVRTKRMLGYAASQQVELPAGEHTIEVLLPERGLSHTVSLLLRGDVHLGLSVEGDQISHVISAEPFGYG